MSEPKEESVSNDHLATFLLALQQLNSELASEAYIAAEKSFNEIKPEHDLARAALAAVRQARPLYKPDPTRPGNNQEHDYRNRFGPEEYKKFVEIIVHDVQHTDRDPTKETFLEIYNTYFYLAILFEVEEFGRDSFDTADTSERPTKTWSADDEIGWLNTMWELVTSAFYEMTEADQVKVMRDFGDSQDLRDSYTMQSVIQGGFPPRPGKLTQ